MTATLLSNPENAQRYFEGIEALGITGSHPDDHLTLTALLSWFQAEYPSVAIKEFDLTTGEDGENHLPDAKDKDFVAQGHRVNEGKASAKHLGISSYTVDDSGKFEDGKLENIESEVTSAIYTWARKHNIRFFVTMMTGDHRDHDTVARSTVAVADQMSRETGQTTYVFGLQPKETEGDPQRADLLVFQASEESTRKALGAALLNASQFEGIEIDPEDPSKQQVHTINLNKEQPWVESHGFLLEPQTHERLSWYAVDGTAVFEITPFGPGVMDTDNIRNNNDTADRNSREHATSHNDSNPASNDNDHELEPTHT